MKRLSFNIQFVSFWINSRMPNNNNEEKKTSCSPYKVIKEKKNRKNTLNIKYIFTNIFFCTTKTSGKLSKNYATHLENLCR